jgi:hypothetical protein
MHSREYQISTAYGSATVTWAHVGTCRSANCEVRNFRLLLLSYVRVERAWHELEFRPLYIAP